MEFLEVIETNEYFCIVMEWVPGGELFDFVCEKGRLLEKEARLILTQLIEGKK